MIKITIGSNIQLARKLNNMTQKQLAEKINKTEASVKKYESDSTNIPVSVLEDIANVFNISKETLIGNETRLKFNLIMKEEQEENEVDILNMYNLLACEIYKEPNNDLYKKYIEYISDINKEYQAANITKKSTKYEIHHDKPLSQKDKLNNSLVELITYANKNTPVKLTEREHEKLFDEVVDYIRYKLYSMGK